MITKVALIEELFRAAQTAAVTRKKTARKPGAWVITATGLALWGHRGDPMKALSLSPQHYAAGWESKVAPTAVINQLGCDYAALSEDNPQKKDLLLQIARAFHGYLLKYLTMISVGHVPMYGSRVNSDVAPFLRYFLPKGETPSREAFLKVCRHLHLAFKGMDTDEVYDALMELLLGAVRRYDPYYTTKVKLITEIIDETLAKQSDFTAGQVTEHLGFDAVGYLRLLHRRGFLETVGERGPEGVRYARNRGTWPPPASFFANGPIGFTYYLQTRFRFSLREWIDERMRQIETREGVYSLDAHSDSVFADSGQQVDLLHAGGDFATADGRRYAADVSLTARTSGRCTSLLMCRCTTWPAVQLRPLCRNLTVTVV